MTAVQSAKKWSVACIERDLSGLFPAQINVFLTKLFPPKINSMLSIIQCSHRKDGSSHCAIKFDLSLCTWKEIRIDSSEMTTETRKTENEKRKKREMHALMIGNKGRCYTRLCKLTNGNYTAPRGLT